MGGVKTKVVSPLKGGVSMFKRSWLVCIFTLLLFFTYVVQANAVFVWKSWNQFLISEDEYNELKEALRMDDVNKVLELKKKIGDRWSIVNFVRNFFICREVVPYKKTYPKGVSSITLTFSGKTYTGGYCEPFVIGKERNFFVLADSFNASKVIKYFVEKHGGDLLSYAALYGCKKTVEILLKYGLDINTPDSEGYLALGDLVALYTKDENRLHKNDYLDMIQFMIDHGADINHPDLHGVTPLTKSAVFCDVELFKYLVKHGGDINFVSEKGVSVLGGAFAGGCYEIANYLVSHGVDVKKAFPNKSVAFDLYEECYMNVKDKSFCDRVLSLLKNHGLPDADYWLVPFFHKYLSRATYSCQYDYFNGHVTEKCGSFTLEYSDSNPKSFRITSNFSNSLSSQIRAIASKRGVTLSIGFDLTPALIRWIVDKVPERAWGYWKRTKNSYNARVLLTAAALSDMVMAADIKTLNMIIEYFVNEKF